MIIELSTGKYLHTAYSITNIPEEMTTLDNEWSLTSQDGMDYIGTFIDGSSTESTDPNDYAWEELIDEDLDDIDEDGDIPVDDFQTQIDELQDQITVNQDDIRNINASMESVQTNIASNSEISTAAMDIANATGQYFWHDENGAHISTEEKNPEGERNSIWNSIGMLFRKGATNLLAVLAGGASGTDPKGIAVYDGEGNNAENVVASFTDSGSVIGKQNDARTIIGNEEVSMINKDGAETFSVKSTGEQFTQIVRDSSIAWSYVVFRPNTPVTSELFKREDPPSSGTSFQIRYKVSDSTYSSSFVYGTASTITRTIEVSSYTSGEVVFTFVYGGENSITVSYTLSGFITSPSVMLVDASYEVSTDAPTFTMGTRNVSETGEGAFSFTAGVSLEAKNQNEVALGKYNYSYDSDGDKSVFTIGGGSSDNSRLNLLEFNDSGDLFVEGSIANHGNLYTHTINATNHVIGIVETGTTSNNWDYRLWSDGTYEAWRSHGFTGMALTSSSAGTYYGGGTTLGVPIFPNNGNTGVTQCLCTASNAFSHSSGVYLYQTEHASATTATSNLTFQFRAHASTSNAACGLDIYLKGTYA